MNKAMERRSMRNVGEKVVGDVPRVIPIAATWLIASRMKGAMRSRSSKP